MRFAVDTGGTFTDLVIEHADGAFELHKSPTTPDDPARGILDVLAVAAAARGVELDALLAEGEMFLHGTTRAVNAIITGNTARTAFLTTAGHPDVLVFREGGRTDPFDYTRPYPEPYVPRALTFEVPERIGAQGEVVRGLEEAPVLETIARLRELEVEAIGVCLLWATVNPAHELRVGELLAEHLPDVPVTLSHKLNPTLREYRRASSAVIDASLKPLMTDYLHGLEQRLRDAGFGGRMVMVTSNAGVLDAAHVADEPIHSINSGPAMAPVAGRHFARVDGASDTAIIADTGGTTYDVSLVRRGRIPTTRETWLGAPYFGHMTGFPSVDIKSVGAGGGSIAWVDDGNLLHVGPRSASAVPGPVAYGRGGTEPTVTDASLVLGFLDPQYFLGGKMKLDVEGARAAIERQVAQPLGLEVDDAAAAILTLATDQMVMAIKEITINQGVDPTGAVLIGGGGAAGLNSVAVAAQLGCPQLIIPQVGAVLSAAGALMSDLMADHAATFVASTASLDREQANVVLADLRARCERFAAAAGASAAETTIEFAFEARYPHQVWELEVPLRRERFEGAEDVARFREDFHALHQDIFAVHQPEAEVEILGARARVSCRLRDPDLMQVAVAAAEDLPADERRVYFPDHGWADAQVVHLDAMRSDASVAGPAVIESPFTTVVVDPGASARRAESGSLVLTIPAAAGDLPAATTAGAAS
ncbi:MAG: hydantoinase/oxoprolinase family protein [Actinobacteria bacterium]|nr:hydantoinase/oxoprolinase family protein [Actinomycetota bacterium]